MICNYTTVSQVNKSYTFFLDSDNNEQHRKVTNIPQLKTIREDLKIELTHIEYTISLLLDKSQLMEDRLNNINESISESPREDSYCKMDVAIITISYIGEFT